jgi:outer membrane autotransporter protein
MVGTQRMRGDATAGSVRASYRVGGQTGFAATPFAQYNYADTKIDPLVIDAFSVWTPGSDTTKIGQAGLRLSYRGGSAATATFEPFISAARMENWSRNDSSSFGFGAPVTTFSLQSNTWKNAMRYSAGILANAHDSRVSGFVVGNIDDDSRLRSFTIHAGLRFNF